MFAAKKRVNWLYATATLGNWKYAITKTTLGNMPLELCFTLKDAIFST
jgi:hypothetical protein